MNEANDNPNDPKMIKKLEPWLKSGGSTNLDSDVIAWLIKHHPDLVKVKLNEEAMQTEIKRLQEAGAEITPDIFPGIKLEPKIRDGRGRTRSRSLN